MKALLIIDVQNDFLPGGSLPVDQGDQIIPIINCLMDRFSLVIATKDYHPKAHISFAKAHHKKNYEEIEIMPGRFQKLWPEHCLQNTWGAELSPLLQEEKISKVFFKGENKDVESYSAFFDEDKKISTGLDNYLKMHQVDRLYITGLTAEYCVKFTALDAISLGYQVYLVEDGIGFIHPQDAAQYFRKMQSKHIHRIKSKDI